MIPEIVLTGGPCSGKTTGLSYLSQKLTDWGFRVYVVPELPTIFIAGGFQDITRLAQEQVEVYWALQTEFMISHLNLLNSFQRAAQARKEDKQVILCDRGAMDGRAYMGCEAFEAALAANNLTLRDVRDRYTGVIHLVTAAAGMEECYSLENNPARQEGPAEARAKDLLTQQAWVGHPHLRVVGNQIQFDEKLQKVLQNITRLLGIPVPIEIERKYVVRQSLEELIPHLTQAVRVEIEQYYLDKEGDESVRIRKRSQHHSASYYLTRKQGSGASRIERDQPIGDFEYLSFKERVSAAYRPIKKDRYCFLHQDQYFELDVFDGDHRGIILLEIELTEEQDTVALPDWLVGCEEVTGNPSYDNEFLARLT